MLGIGISYAVVGLSRHGFPEETRVTKRRLEIIFERERLLILGRRRVSTIAWCGGCHARVLMVMPDEAAKLNGVTARAVYQMVEADQVHFIETADRILLICCESLQKSV